MTTTIADSEITDEEIRRRLQALISREHDLVHRAIDATASGQYRRLRDFADGLLEVSESRMELRAALAVAKARDAADKKQASLPRRLPDIPTSV